MTFVVKAGSEFALIFTLVLVTISENERKAVLLVQGHRQNFTDIFIILKALA